MKKGMVFFKIPKRFSIFGQYVQVIFDDNLYEETGFISSTYPKINAIYLDKSRTDIDEISKDKLNELFFERAVKLIFDTLFSERTQISGNNNLMILFSKALYQMVNTINTDLIALSNTNCLDEIYKNMKSFYLFGRPIEICFVKNLNRKAAYIGLASFNPGRMDIQINCEECLLSRDRIMEAFFHETVHHIFDTLGYDKLKLDESVVILLGFALHQFFKTMEY